MMASREKLAAKIAALKAKTTAAGCTEAEALAAAERAAELMREHGLSDADIEMVTASADEKTVRATWRTQVAGIVAHVTNTSAIFLPTTSTVEFIGRDPGPEIAAYLYAVIVGAVERASREFKTTTEYTRRRTTKTRRTALFDFANGMVRNLRFRLILMFRSTMSDEALAASKRALDIRYPDSRTRKAPDHKPRFANAADAGWQAGKKVTLAHGVAGPEGRPLAIGGGS